MPKLPTDMEAARAYAYKDRMARAAREKKEREALAHDEQIIRDFANELRAKVGEPPLRPDEPVKAIICRRGRR